MNSNIIRYIRTQLINHGRPCLGMSFRCEALAAINPVVSWTEESETVQVRRGPHTLCLHTCGSRRLGASSPLGPEVRWVLLMFVSPVDLKVGLQYRSCRLLMNTSRPIWIVKPLQAWGVVVI